MNPDSHTKPQIPARPPAFSRPRSRSPLVRGFTLLTALLAIQGQCRAAEIADDFSKGNDQGWSHYDPFAALGVKNSFQVIGGEYVLGAPASPVPDLAPSMVLATRPEINWTNFDIRVNLSGWDTGSKTNVLLEVGARQKDNGDGSFDGYGLVLQPSETPELASKGVGSVAALIIESISHNRLTPLVQGRIHELSPDKWYQVRFIGQGELLIARLYEAGNLSNPISEIYTRDGTFHQGMLSLGAIDLAGFAGLANNGAHAKFDQYLATDTPAAADLKEATPAPSYQVVDTFSSGNDTNWVHFDPFAAFGMPSTFQVVDNAYLLAAPPSPAPQTMPATVMAMRPELDWADFQLSADFTGWSDNPATNIYIGLAARQAPNAAGAFDGYQLRVITGGSPKLTNSVSNPFLGIDLWTTNGRTSLAWVDLLTVDRLDPTQWYRAVFTGKGDVLTASLSTRDTPDVPLLKFSVIDQTYQHGFVSLAALDRFGWTQAGNGGVRVIFDNFEGYGVPLPPPLTIERAVILSWPASTAGWLLEQTDDAAGTWTTVDAAAALSGGRNVVTIKVDTFAKFYRLRSR